MDNARHFYNRISLKLTIIRTLELPLAIPEFVIFLEFSVV